MDWVLLTLIMLMVTTLGAFFLQITPYPVGAALLLVLVIFRLRKMKSSRP